VVEAQTSEQLEILDGKPSFPRRTPLTVPVEGTVLKPLLDEALKLVERLD
jgi:hypothetical protein